MQSKSRAVRSPSLDVGAPLLPSHPLQYLHCPMPRLADYLAQAQGKDPGRADGVQVCVHGRTDKEVNVSGSLDTCNLLVCLSVLGLTLGPVTALLMHR